MNKIDDLMERLEQVRLARDNEGEPDGLSASLWELGAELSALNAEEITALADELGIAPEDVEEMARSYAR